MSERLETTAGSASARLAVVIVGYGNADSIAECVRRARALDDVAEVVVVDHGTDGTADIAEAVGARVFRRPQNPGFGAGQNRGVRATTAPYVLLLNPDAVPVPAGIAAGLATIDADHGVAMVQGVIVNQGTGEPERSQGRELGPVHLYGRALGAKRLLALRPVRAVAARIGVLADHVDRVPDAPVPVASLAATAVIVRRDAFDSVGGFDESYFLYGEDLDLCHRLRAAGWTLLALPQRFALHVGGASASTAVARERTWWRGTMRFAALWWSPAAWNAALGAAVLQWCALVARRPSLAACAWWDLVWAPVRDRREVTRAGTRGVIAPRRAPESAPRRTPSSSAPTGDDADIRPARARAS